MRNTFFFPAWGVISLILVVLTVVSCFLLVPPSHADQASAPQPASEFSWTADDGDGSEPSPVSESSYSDYNPSCTGNQPLPAYCPTVSPLVHFEPFKALPQVYRDRFVPPQNFFTL